MLARRVIISVLVFSCAATPVCAAALSSSTAKVAPALMAQLAASPTSRKSVILVTNHSRRGVAAASVRGGPLRFTTITANAAQVSKYAARADVAAVLPDVPPQPIGMPDLGPPPALAAAFSPTASLPVLPQTWGAKSVHRVSEAWALGYTGQGVTVAIVDEGVDFGHPDLQGRQARVRDPNSPYFGWPMALDPYAMNAYATRGRYFGGYVRTTTTATGAAVSFNGRVHKLTGTSVSGVYHLGLHPGYHLMFTNPWGKQPSVLVADEHQAGVYDTVYVDLNKNADFTDDKPCRKGDEISWWDADGDGLADWSGGMLYFIADGVKPIPAIDWLYPGAPIPGNGNMVAFAGAFGKNELHGTLCASAVAAQGVISDGAPPWKPAGSGGMVQGLAPGAEIIQVGDIYKGGQAVFDALRFCAYGYDGLAGTGDEPNIVNMSFGYSTIRTGGWDFVSRFLGQLATESPNVSFVAAAGNGAPGYGTVTAPAASPFALAVGAATQYGSTDVFEEIASAAQITSGQIQPWSGRGPSALGMVKPDVAAVGAFATGDVPLGGYGAGAWATWAGTSLASPMACGILALVYEAYRQAHSSYPTWREARELLKSASTDLGYEPFSQGAGLLDAYRAVRAASESHGLTVSPDTWNAGDYRGKVYEAFPRTVIPGRSYSQTFEVRNRRPFQSGVLVEPVELSLVSRRQISLTAQTAAEPPYDFLKPDYLFDLRPYVALDANLVRVRLTFRYATFSLSNPSSRSLAPASQWTLIVYEWTDLNHNGRYWNDCCPANGMVDQGELDPMELNRVTFGSNSADYVEASIGKPWSRGGMFERFVVGLQHRQRDPTIPMIPLTITFDSYRRRPWAVVSLSANSFMVPGNGSAQFTASLRFPFFQKPGLQTGYLRIGDPDYPSEITLVPVAANVVSASPIDSPRPKVADGVSVETSPYLNGAMFGGFDWSWRPESGDWRSFLFDVSSYAARNPSAQVLATASWNAVPTDIDLLVQGPATDVFSQSAPEVYGPHSLALAGGSRDTNLGDGRYSFETATGGPSEWVSGPIAEGLNLVQCHAVLYDGNAPEAPYSLEVGKLWCQPSDLYVTAGGAGQISTTVYSNLAMRDPIAQAYGFSTPQLYANESVRQDPQDMPSTASYLRDIRVTDAGLMRFSTSSPNPIDIDLYLLHDADNNGQFDWNTEVIASSAGPDAREFIEVKAPPSGGYRIAVHGYSVSPSPSVFDLSSLVVQGKLPTQVKPILNSLTQRAVVTAQYSSAPVGAVGALLFGPSVAPAAVTLPIAVR